MYVYDYVMFAVFVVLCMGVPLWNKQQPGTKADYVFSAGSQVCMVAMMLFIARGTLGVRSILGYPAELYYRGSAMWEVVYGMILSYPIVCFVFLPVYYSLGITSVYQYLDLRFKSRLVRCLASFTYVARNLLNLGVTVFTPCVALRAVIGLPYWASITSIAVITVLCTILGGLKAAIHADVIQGVTMMACSLAIIVQGCLNAHGPGRVIDICRQRGRLRFFNFDMDPTVRMTTVSAVVGQLFISLSIFGCQQSFVQRYCSMGSQWTAVKTLLGNVPVVVVLCSLSWVAGMAIFSSYADCDPLQLGLISSMDELVPFFVQDQFSGVPGLLGVFMAALFNGALSHAVSIINSLSTVTWEDFFCQFPRFQNLSDQRQLFLMKMIGAFYGLVVIVIAFGVTLFTGIIESSMLMTSATSGPLLGVFLLAMLFPGANWKGAASGMVASHALTLWITLQALLLPRGTDSMLPLSTAGCTNDSYSELRPPGALQSVPRLQLLASVPPGAERGPRDFLHELYSISYMYYTLFGCTITVVLGIIISYCTGTTPEDVYDKKLVHPLALKVSTLFPGTQREYAMDKSTRSWKHASCTTESNSKFPHPEKNDKP